MLTEKQDIQFYSVPMAIIKEVGIMETSTKPIGILVPVSITVDSKFNIIRIVNKLIRRAE